MNIKEFKQRWLNSKIEPELFYMPVKKKDEKKYKINFHVFGYCCVDIDTLTLTRHQYSTPFGVNTKLVIQKNTNNVWNTVYKTPYNYIETTAHTQYNFYVTELPTGKYRVKILFAPIPLDNKWHDFEISKDATIDICIGDIPIIIEKQEIVNVDIECGNVVKTICHTASKRTFYKLCSSGTEKIAEDVVPLGMNSNLYRVKESRYSSIMIADAALSYVRIHKNNTTTVNNLSVVSNKSPIYFGSAPGPIVSPYCNMDLVCESNIGKWVIHIETESITDESDTETIMSYNNNTDSNSYSPTYIPSGIQYKDSDYDIEQASFILSYIAPHIPLIDTSKTSIEVSPTLVAKISYNIEMNISAVLPDAGPDVIEHLTNGLDYYNTVNTHRIGSNMTYLFYLKNGRMNMSQLIIPIPVTIDLDWQNSYLYINNYNDVYKTDYFASIDLWDMIQFDNISNVLPFYKDDPTFYDKCREEWAFIINNLYTMVDISIPPSENINGFFDRTYYVTSDRDDYLTNLIQSNGWEKYAGDIKTSWFEYECRPFSMTILPLQKSMKKAEKYFKDIKILENRGDTTYDYVYDDEMPQSMANFYSFCMSTYTGYYDGRYAYFLDSDIIIDSNFISILNRSGRYPFHYKRAFYCTTACNEMSFSDDFEEWYKDDIPVQ